MKYTLGDVKFTAVIIADFEESLKSVTTLLYTDVSPKISIWSFQSVV